jgi:hypothetical protein
MNTIDLIQICAASALTGAASVVIVFIILATIRQARAERYRRENYVSGRTIRPHLHL